MYRTGQLKSRSPKNRIICFPPAGQSPQARLRVSGSICMRRSPFPHPLETIFYSRTLEKQLFSAGFELFSTVLLLLSAAQDDEPVPACRCCTGCSTATGQSTWLTHHTTLEASCWRLCGTSSWVRMLSCLTRSSRNASCTPVNPGQQHLHWSCQNRSTSCSAMQCIVAYMFLFTNPHLQSILQFILAGCCFLCWLLSISSAIAMHSVCRSFMTLAHTFLEPSLHS